jgi:hypothetical protein
MMKHKFKLAVAALALLVSAWVPPASAGIISNVSLGEAPGGGGMGNCATQAANNDNVVGASPNTCSIEKAYNKFDYIDMQFTVLNSGGTTEYQFTELILNDWWGSWHDFHFDLGFGTGQNFISSGNGDFLDFDEPDNDSPVASSHFLDHMFDNVVDSLWFDNGKCGNGALCNFTFAIDVPDHNNPGQIPASYHILDAQGAVIGYQFTLRQTPSIPEPLSLALMSLGLLLLRLVKR